MSFRGTASPVCRRTLNSGNHGHHPHPAPASAHLGSPCQGLIRGAEGKTPHCLGPRAKAGEGTGPGRRAQQAAPETQFKSNIWNRNLSCLHLSLLSGFSLGRVPPKPSDISGRNGPHRVFLAPLGVCPRSLVREEAAPGLVGGRSQQNPGVWGQQHDRQPPPGPLCRVCPAVSTHMSLWSPPAGTRLLLTGVGARSCAFGPRLSAGRTQGPWGGAKDSRCAAWASWPPAQEGGTARGSG